MNHPVDQNHTSKDHLPKIRLWILCVCMNILLMVVIGGITRLTGSGLSIVNWDPIMGAIPPLTDSSWNEVYSSYLQSPQGQLINSGMTLSQFKFIFFWEYIHRLLGRLLGLVFLIPWIYFIIKKQISKPLALKLFGGFLLGGLQGLMGWYMVKSGLVNNPHVSHFRLAAHLALALVVLVYLMRFYFKLAPEQNLPVVPEQTLFRFKWAVRLFTTGVALQIIYGAFTSGLKAGHAYPTFPKMNGSWLPPEALIHSPAWINALENPAMVQFIHRCLGWMLLSGAIILFAYAKRFLPKPHTRPFRLLLSLIILQFLLGVSTLVLGVPLAIAITHQFTGTLTWLFCFWILEQLRRME